MTTERIRELLAELDQEIRNSEVDAETRSALARFDTDVHRLLDPTDESSDGEQLIERAKLLEADFAASHPALERFMREVIDALVRIGV